MKKLMIAATIAALAGASFADCNEKCGFAYRMKVMVRTTVAHPVNNSSTCTDGCYRNPEIRRFIGFIYGLANGAKADCCGCNNWGAASVALWDFDNRRAITLKDSELFLLDRVGYQKTDKCEMSFQLNPGEDKCGGKGKLVFSGYGSCGIHDGEITVGAVAGYCAGYLPSFCMTKDKNCNDTCTPSTAWDLCGDTKVTPANTAAYGKWTLTWDSGAAAQVGAALATTSARIDGVTTTPDAFKWAK